MLQIFSVFFTIISSFFLCTDSILNGFFRTTVDTCHTMGTERSPYWFPILYGNIIEHTLLLAFSTADAVFCHMKRSCFDDMLIKKSG